MSDHYPEERDPISPPFWNDVNQAQEYLPHPIRGAGFTEPGSAGQWNEPVSTPWVQSLDGLTARDPSSPYPPSMRQGNGSETLYPPPPPSTPQSGRTRRLRILGVAGLAIILIIGCAIAALGISGGHPPAVIAIVKTTTPTSASTATALTIASPQITPTSQTTPATQPTATNVPGANPSPTPKPTIMPSPTPAPFDVDDTVTGSGTDQFTFVGGSDWREYTGATGPYDGTLNTNNTGYDYATFAFHGIELKWYGTKQFNGGIMGFTVDGGPETDVSCYSALQMHQQLFFDTGVLARGSHIVKMIVGGKNTGIGGVFSTVDFVTVYP